MNPWIPEWNLDYELPGSTTSQKKPYGLDDGLVELLWQNGQVVLHSQNHRKQQQQEEEVVVSKQDHHHQSNHLIIQENETVSWLHDPFQKDGEGEEQEHDDFCSNLLSEIPGVTSNVIQTQTENSIDQQFDNSSKAFKYVPSGGGNGCGFVPEPLPPPRFQTTASSTPAAVNPSPVVQGVAKGVQFQDHSRYPRGRFGDQGEVKECSVMTVGSSHCGSNQVAVDADNSRVSTSGFRNNGGLSASFVKNYTGKISTENGRGDREAPETALTSSSGGSGSSFAKTCNQSATTNSLKRKSRDGEESECQNQAAALDSAAGDKPTQKSGSYRKSRAAEVHNLSERRRRDRINEKMKALQELIPHSNKSDKASMLDEAIEYMKSLQLQLQMLWMGSGMAAPMMFPGVQHYMSRLGMGIAPPALPAIHSSMHHLPRLPPLVDQAINIAQIPNQASICQPSVLNAAVNLQNQLRNPNFQDQYAGYLGFHQLQNISQQMNMFSFGSNAATQQNPLVGQQPNHSNGAPTR